ncbi:hypothetical protein JOQ06_023966 [Pogonophryne albipinna]|uniref:Uncharacterized protein n=1 Tax=Pogonophryne albipinna TaxID=1090488 RepID=A0AAD6BLE2_9TELE|nr:hypothetical protein JOQ06_023966 [Pogonophryne albipinna]
MELPTRVLSAAAEPASVGQPFPVTAGWNMKHLSLPDHSTYVCFLISPCDLEVEFINIPNGSSIVLIA